MFFSLNRHDGLSQKYVKETGNESDGRPSQRCGNIEILVPSMVATFSFEIKDQKQSGYCSIASKNLCQSIPHTDSPFPTLTMMRAVRSFSNTFSGGPHLHSAEDTNGGGCACEAPTLPPC